MTLTVYHGVAIVNVGLSWYVGDRWFPTRAAARAHVRAQQGKKS